MPEEQRYPQRVFVDATYTVSSGQNSGIERVVRRLLSGTQDAAQSHQWPVPQLVINEGGHFYVADEAYLAASRTLAARHANILATKSRAYRFLATLLCNATGSSKLRKWLLPQAGHFGIFKLTHSLRHAAARRKLTKTAKPIAARPGDLFLLPDAYWIHRLRKSVWLAASAARRRGAFITTVIYDLIPLTHPEFVGEKRRDGFLDYITQAASNSDQILAISETVRDQVREFLPSLATEDDHFCEDVRAFELGAELGDPKDSDYDSLSDESRVRSRVAEVFSGEPIPYLTVSAFDPRKNHPYLLDAFERLWEQGEDVKLCLVGRIGARCDELVCRIREHEELGKRLFLFEDLSDTELHHCYKNARGVIFPSIVEGYGLPIVESLWFGKKTFASDTSIHREVGRGDCVYFDLADPDRLVERVLDWECTLQSGKAPELPTRKLTTWLASCEQVMGACTEAMNSCDLESQRNVAA